MMPDVTTTEPATPVVDYPHKTLRRIILGVAIALTVAQVATAIYVTAYCKFPIGEGTSGYIMLITLGLVAIAYALRPKKRQP